MFGSIHSRRADICGILYFILFRSRDEFSCPFARTFFAEHCKWNGAVIQQDTERQVKRATGTATEGRPIVKWFILFYHGCNKAE